MIRVKLSRLMGDKRINMSKLAEATGIARSSIFALYHEKIGRIDLATLDRLCTFFDCQPGDILEWQPETKGARTSLPRKKNTTA